MLYNYTPYIWPYIGTIIMNLIMIIYVHKNRHRQGVNPFIAALVFSTLWCLGTVMEISAVDFASKLFWSKAGFPAYTFGPLFWMIMVLQLTDRDYWINKKRMFLMSIIPVLTVILVWTNDYHGLIWSKISVEKAASFSSLIVEHGLWFWVHAVYSDGLNLISVLLTIRYWKRKAPLYGKQYTYLAFSMLFIMLVNATYVLRIGPDIDMTSVAWGISSLFLTWALFRNKLFDIVPIARNRVMENISDGIVVVDISNRIVDMNPSAQTIFKCRIIENIGRSATEFFNDWPEIRELAHKEEGAAEFEQVLNEEFRSYDASCMPVKNESGNLLGKILIIRDITEKKITERELLKRQQKISIKEERERLARDLHDNIGQILGFVNVQTQAVKEYIKQNQTQTALQCLERLTEVAQEAHNTVRQTIIAMRGEMEGREKKLGDFFNVLERNIQLLEQGYGIKTEIRYKRVNNSEVYDSKSLDQVSNILKEAINNIIKHSSASAVNIEVNRNEDDLCISVIDNGCGIDIKSIAPDEKKYGLLFMRERAAEIGGRFEIYSDKGKGTRIELRLPIGRR